MCWHVQLQLHASKGEGWGMYFRLILVGILSIFILSVKNRGWGGVYLMKKNPLSMTKVIC